MRPSESAVGQAWLTNFHPTEVPAATILLDRLRFVSLRGLWTGLLDLLQRFASEGERTPFVVYPERSLDSFQMDPEPGMDEAPVAWTHFVPGAPIVIPAGSDAFVAMVLKELRDLDYEAFGGIPTDAALDTLRDQRCRSLVLATDIVASGEQIDELAAAITRNKRIQSWRSFRWLQIHVVAFGVMQAGLDRLAASRHVDGVHYVERVPTIFSLPLSDEVREAVVRLCNRHAGGEEPLGFLETGALFATERRAPDNVPGLFTRPSSLSWQALFPSRSVPPRFAAEVGDYRGNEALQEVAERVGQLRLGRNQRVTSVRAGSRAVLQALTLADRAALEPDDLAQSLGTDRSTAENLLSSLQSWDFLDADGRLTGQGRLELNEYKRGRRRTTAELEGSEAPYYHQSVR